MALFALASALGTTREHLLDTMPYQEFIGWIAYYEQRELISKRARNRDPHVVENDWASMDPAAVQRAFGAVGG